MNENDEVNGDIYVEMNCPRCVHGLMRFTRQHPKDNPELNIHQCIRCGYIGVYKEIFPVKIG